MPIWAPKINWYNNKPKQPNMGYQLWTGEGIKKQTLEACTWFWWWTFFLNERHVFPNIPKWQKHRFYILNRHEMWRITINTLPVVFVGCNQDPITPIPLLGTNQPSSRRKPADARRTKTRACSQNLRTSKSGFKTRGPAEPEKMDGYTHNVHIADLVASQSFSALPGPCFAWSLYRVSPYLIYCIGKANGCSWWLVPTINPINSPGNHH